MMRGVHHDSRACSTSVSRRWRLIAVLALAGVAAGAVSGDAASVSLSWNAPTTNANGTPLTDLAGYRIYLGTTPPACPGASFHAVSSPTTTPTTGQTVAHRVTGLSAGATYVVRVTAVDTAGNESSCSGSASGVAQPDFSVTPATTATFGSITTGSTVDRTFTVQNTSGASLSGAASVGPPFSIASGGSFALSSGASHTVTVRFGPTTAGSFAGNVNFTAGGDTLSRGVSGSATGGTSPALSVTKTGTGSGTVTSSPAGIACGTDCMETVASGTQLTLTASPASGSVFAGWSGACSGTGSCAVTPSGATTVTATFNAAANPLPVVSSLSPASAAAGASGLTLTVNGSGFVASSAVRWNGATRATTFVSATQLRASISASDLATPASVPVSVVTPAPGGGTSGVVSFAVTAPPVPSTPPAPPTGLSSTQLVADGTGVTFAIGWGAGSGAASYRYVAGFSDGSATQQGTVTTSPLQLRMQYHASGAAFGGYVCVGSVNAAGQSSTDQACAGLSVPARPATLPAAPVPVASSLSPASTVAGSAGFTLTVNGSGFVASSVVRWNSATRATTFVSATQLRAAISASDLASPGSVPVSVVTPAPGGGTSGVVSFAITAPPAPSTPPAAPGSPSVTQVAADSAGVTFAVAWGAVSGAVSYGYAAGFSDGTAAQQGTVTTPALQLRMPYHVSGAAAGGFVCLQSVNAAGQQSADQACKAVPVPARPATTPPAMPGSPSVTRLSADAGGVTFVIAWSAVSGAASYRYVAGFGDGSAAQQGAVTGLLSFQLRMPYHASGAAFGGFVCLRSVGAAGQMSTDQACNAVSVPARP